jgi:hypothetical protein
MCTGVGRRRRHKPVAVSHRSLLTHGAVTSDFPAGRSGYARERYVDWYLETSGSDDVQLVQQEIGRYLYRHAEHGEAVPDAELVVSELVGNAARHTTGPVWVSLVWTARQPTLSVYDLSGPGSSWILACLTIYSRRADVACLSLTIWLIG